MKLRTVFLILGVAVIVLDLLIANDFYSDRAVNTPEGDELVDITPVWLTLAVGVGLLVASMAFDRDALADKRAPPYLGQMASSDPGEPDKTLEKAGEMKRVGGEY